MIFLKALKSCRFLGAVVLGYLAISLFQPDTAYRGVIRSIGLLGEIVTILPPVMLLMGLFDVWVPKAFIERNMGPGAGLRGIWLAMLLGAAAAGPLYAAFPVALTLRTKGARLAFVVIFLGTWAAIKIPMLLMESSFIGPRFALLRLMLTVPGVIGVGFLMERLVPQGIPLQEPGSLIEAGATANHAPSGSP
jgi:uncharacterized membrane protein YraQ (UPF0718 family)